MFGSFHEEKKKITDRQVMAAIKNKLRNYSSKYRGIRPPPAKLWVPRRRGKERMAEEKGRREETPPKKA